MFTNVALWCGLVDVARKSVKPTKSWDLHAKAENVKERLPQPGASEIYKILKQLRISRRGQATIIICCVLGKERRWLERCFVCFGLFVLIIFCVLIFKHFVCFGILILCGFYFKRFVCFGILILCGFYFKHFVCFGILMQNMWLKIQVENLEAIEIDDGNTWLM